MLSTTAHGVHVVVRVTPEFRRADVHQIVANERRLVHR